MATLVDEATGKRVHPYRDYVRLRRACQELERELGLRATAGADRTAAPAPKRAERAKAARLGRELTAREELHRVVRRCAATSHDGPGFLAALAEEGLDPRTVLDATGRSSATRWPGATTALATAPWCAMPAPGSHPT